tara:strand:+ start:428 stop:598 length:171 start_codon:yes stop_codon:yes gene_type:complete
MIILMVLMRMAPLAYRDSPITATEAGSTALRVVVTLVVTEVGTEEVVISNPVQVVF